MWMFLCNQETCCVNVQKYRPKAALPKDWVCVWEEAGGGTSVEEEERKLNQAV